MIVTKVKKERNQMLVFFDEKNINISLNCWARNYIREGIELSQDQCNLLLKESELDFLIEDGHEFLKKARSEFELKEFLYKINCDLADEAMDYFISHGYIDDHQFMMSYLLVNKNKKGPVLIRRELTSKGIDSDIIDAEILNLSDEFDQILEKMIMKELSLYRKGSIKAFVQKVTQKLVDKGFLWEEVKKKVEEKAFLLDNIDEDVSLQGDYECLLNRYSKKYSGIELERKVTSALINKGYNLENIKNKR